MPLRDYHNIAGLSSLTMLNALDTLMYICPQQETKFLSRLTNTSQS
jgi:hypothetical protein